MAVTIIPPSTDILLSLHSAHTPSIASEIPSGTIHDHLSRGTFLENLPLLLSVSDVQNALGLGRNSTYQLLRSGKLKSIRVGKLIKIPRAALEEYLSSY